MEQRILFCDMCKKRIKSYLLVRTVTEDRYALQINPNPALFRKGLMRHMHVCFNCAITEFGLSTNDPPVPEVLASRVSALLPKDDRYKEIGVRTQRVTVDGLNVTVYWRLRSSSSNNESSVSALLETSGRTANISKLVFDLVTKMRQATGLS